MKKTLTIPEVNNLIAPHWVCVEDGGFYSLYFLKPQPVADSKEIKYIQIPARKWKADPKLLVEVIQYVARRG